MNIYLFTIIVFCIVFVILHESYITVTFLCDMDSKSNSTYSLILSKDNSTTLSEVEIYEEILIKKISEVNNIYYNWIFLNSIHNRKYPFTFLNLFSFGRPDNIREIVKGANMSIKRMDTYINIFLCNYNDVETLITESLLVTMMLCGHQMNFYEFIMRILLKSTRDCC